MIITLTLNPAIDQALVLDESRHVHTILDADGAALAAWVAARPEMVNGNRGELSAL